MRKFTILSLILVIAFSLNAQKRLTIEKAPNRMDAYYDNGESTNINAPYRRAVGGVPIGSSQNIYGILLAGPHQVMYNSAINTVVFTHRALDAGGHDSGELAFDFSTDGGYNWTTEAWISQQVQGADAECRYPSITIYNPDGNTDVANARVIGNGPSLIGYGASSGWGYSYEIDATIEATPTTNEYYGSNNGDNTDFHPYGLEMGPDGTAWSASASYNSSTQEYNDVVYINKATYNSGTDKFDWQSPFYTINLNLFYSGTDKLFNGWDVAVHPTDPNIVYAVANCMEVGDTKEVPTPHVWKTTDGGTNWVELAPIDFTAEPLATQMDAYIIYNNGEPMKPYIVDIDATVDSDGKLHVFSTVYSGALDFGFIYGLSQPAGRHYMDFTTTDGTDWAMTYINDLECEAADFGDVKTYVHPQVGRNEAGTDIFYTWSETFAETDSLNTAPNMMAAHWNTTNGLVSDSLNLTDGTGAQGISYFPQVSPVFIDNGDGTFEVPMVIAMINFATGTDMDQANFMYLTGVVIDTPVGVNKVSKPDVLIYPNPVAEKVFVSVGAKVEMYNILGAKLLTVEGQNNVTTIEMSNYPVGTYLLKVYTDKGIVTKKIQKVN